MILSWQAEGGTGKGGWGYEHSNLSYFYLVAAVFVTAEILFIPYW